MAHYKIQVPRAYRALDVGDQYQGWDVVATVPGSQQVIINLPDDYDAAAVQRLMEAWEQRGLIERDGRGLFRREHDDYGVLWLPDRPTVLANAAVGDTFEMQGITEATRQRGKYGAGVIVALVDTGVDPRHIAFDGKDVQGDLADEHGHGTWCASHAASTWGVASDAAIYMRNGLPGGSGSEALIANCLRDCADHIVRARAPGVVSLSLGGSGSALIDDACSYVRARGIAIVAAAGNTAGAPIGSPARAADLIVMAVDRARNYANFTSGVGWTNPNRVSAVGVDVASAKANTRDQTLTISGTSMATPLIAGHCALLLAGGG